MLVFIDLWKSSKELALHERKSSNSFLETLCLGDTLEGLTGLLIGELAVC